MRALSEAVDEVDREVKVRERCFPRWVSEGKITNTDARDRLERLQAAREYLSRTLSLQEAHAEIGGAPDPRAPGKEAM